ncbi:HK97-gp10 family putative phage morphogenesis protein [Jiella marina]|uniref:hypothetical protein n=1 Tax=Jiella sp. LLJ827 TaxID=2917712 RepID=UPI00210144D9|nr:hypothetical protein [Jiella sp. LLJ827]MCQ0987544.1 hypothetical protein [Jiella sp. LLJ827]
MAKLPGRSRGLRVLKNLPKAARKAVRESIDVEATNIGRRQKRLAPKRSGTLASTIERSEVRETRRDVSVTLMAGGDRTTKPVRNGADTEYDYALGVEFGNEDMPAQPFFYPPIRGANKRIRRRARRLLKQAAKEAVQRS